MANLSRYRLYSPPCDLQLHIKKNKKMYIKNAFIPSFKDATFWYSHDILDWIGFQHIKKTILADTRWSKDTYFWMRNPILSKKNAILGGIMPRWGPEWAFWRFLPISGQFPVIFWHYQPLILSESVYHFIGMDGGGGGIENDSRRICFLAFLHDKLTSMYMSSNFFCYPRSRRQFQKKILFYNSQTFIKDVKAVWVVLGGLRHQGVVVLDCRAILASV